MAEILNSVTDVIKSLGGVNKTARALGENPNTIGNWQTRARIPPEHFLNVSQALRAQGKKVAPEVFGMKLAAE
jgi:hypothetical protein